MFIFHHQFKGDYFFLGTEEDMEAHGMMGYPAVRSSERYQGDYKVGDTIPAFIRDGDKLTVEHWPVLDGSTRYPIGLELFLSNLPES